MDPAERDERVMSLAAEALKTPRLVRESWLQAACQNDPDLYREVSEIVAWEERMEGFLSRPLIEFIDLETLEKIFENGQVVAGRFEITRCVGSGGMGVVYEAYDRKRKQRIAIKCAKPGFGRLLSPELEGALKVRHPNICMVNEIHSAATEFGDLNFLTMEFLDGETLGERLARGKFEEVEAMKIARQLCAGVTEAHQSGVLHRDLKPDNVILCPGKDGGTRAVIMDFGLAAEDSVASVAGGTPSYMAPELWRGGKASQASDVFSLGVILYQIVTGQKPFPRSTENNADSHPPLPPSQITKGLSHRWNKAILPCLKAQPADRISASEVLATLERKPLYRRPAATLALASVFVLAAVSPQVVAWITPPPFKLAVLPAEGPQDLVTRGNQMLATAAERVKEMQIGKATVSVIPLSKALNKGVTTPDKAADVLGATHALELALHPETNGVTATWKIIDLKTMAEVRKISGHFSGSEMDDLPGGLTGSIALAMHLHRTANPESVNQAAKARYESGLKYLDREPRDFIDATTEFQEAARLDPHSPLPLARLAEARAREYQATRQKDVLPEARAWLDRAEALNADSLQVRLTSGLLNAVQGHDAKALEDYQRVEEVDPRNVEALIGSGFYYESQKRLDQAVAYYQRAIAADPGNCKSYQYLGALYHYSGRYAEAEGPFRQEIKCAPGRLDGYSNLAGVYIAQGRYSEAEQVFASSPKGQETASLLNNIGAKLAFQAKDAEAVYYYKQAIEQNPYKTIYWLNLGDSQRRIGGQIQARNAYQRGLQLAETEVTTNPGSASARGYLAYLQVRLGRKAQARAEIAAALNTTTADDQVVLCAVQTYEVLGDRSRALESLAQATRQTRQLILHHPDLAGLRGDSRFILVMGQSQ